MIAGGMIAGDILNEYPDLEPEDILAALRYAAEALAEHYYPSGHPHEVCAHAGHLTVGDPATPASRYRTC